MKNLIFTILLFTINTYTQELQNITVKPGDTLWSISNKYLQDPKKWDIILKYNKLPPNPYAALPGMTLKIPVEILKEEYRAAKFLNLINDVKLRKKDLSQWQKATIKDELYNGDTLRTNIDSKADVRFYTGQILNLLSNSMVVVRPPKKEADIQLISGQIKSVDTKVITASAKIIPKVAGTEFGAKVKEDLSTLVQVYKGAASVEAKGKKVEVKEGFGTEVKIDMPPSEPVKLPPTAKFEDMDTKFDKTATLKLEGNVISINNSKTIKNTSAQTNIKLGNVAISTKEVSTPDSTNIKTPNINDKDTIDSKEIIKTIDISKTISAYHIQISKDRDFNKIVFDKTSDIFTKINLEEHLPKGNYWFRVSYIDLLGFEGKFSEPKSISVQ